MRPTRVIGILLPIALLTTGCATRDWVREVLGKKDAEIDQRFSGVDQRVGTVESRASDDAQRIEGMGFRLKTVEGGLEETGGVARAARDSAVAAQGRADAAHERADAAYTKADDVNGRLTRLWGQRNKRDLVESLDVRFGFNKWDLSDGAQTSLVALVRELRENPRLSVDLQGYADPAGTYDYNVALSQRRVEAVRRFLVEKGIELPRIHAVGLGPIMDGGLPAEQKRRVSVRLMIHPD